MAKIEFTMSTIKGKNREIAEEKKKKRLIFKF